MIKSLVLATAVALGTTSVVQAVENTTTYACASVADAQFENNKHNLFAGKVGSGKVFFIKPAQFSSGDNLYEVALHTDAVWIGVRETEASGITAVFSFTNNTYVKTVVSKHVSSVITIINSCEPVE